MKKSDWKKKIKKATEDAGTYRPFFDAAIDTLAEIMALRDDARRKFTASGGDTVVLNVNKAGNEYYAKNPALVVIDDMNKTALQYWRDLGLTPAGLRRIDEQALKGKQVSALAEALKEMSNE